MTNKEIEKLESQEKLDAIERLKASGDLLPPPHRDAVSHLSVVAEYDLPVKWYVFLRELVPVPAALLVALFDMMTAGIFIGLAFVSRIAWAYLSRNKPRRVSRQEARVIVEDLSLEPWQEAKIRKTFQDFRNNRGKAYMLSQKGSYYTYDYERLPCEDYFVRVNPRKIIKVRETYSTQQAEWFKTFQKTLNIK